MSKDTIRKHAADILSFGATEYFTNYYELTAEEQEKLHTYHSQYTRLRQDTQTLLLNGYKRKTATVFTFEKHINEPEEYVEHYSFIADLAYDHAHMFEDCDDNHEVAALFSREGILNREAGDREDPEACCYFAYFKTEEAARGFIDRLNAMAVRRSANRE